MSEQTATTRKSYHVSVPSVDVTIFIRLGADPEMRYTPNGKRRVGRAGRSVPPLPERRRMDGAGFVVQSRCLERSRRTPGRPQPAQGRHRLDHLHPADAKAEPFTGRDGTAMASLTIGFANVKVFAQDASAEATEAPAADAPEDEIPF